MKPQWHSVAKGTLALNTITGCIVETYQTIESRGGSAEQVSTSSVFVPGEHWNHTTGEFEEISQSAHRVVIREEDE